MLTVQFNDFWQMWKFFILLKFSLMTLCSQFLPLDSSPKQPMICFLFLKISFSSKNLILKRSHGLYTLCLASFTEHHVWKEIKIIKCVYVYTHMYMYISTYIPTLYIDAHTYIYTHICACTYVRFAVLYIFEYIYIYIYSIISHRSSRVPLVFYWVQIWY